MKSRLTTVLCAALCLSPVAALAADYYAGASAGRAKLKVDAGIFSKSDQSTAFKLYTGYRVDQRFGLEAGYVQHGKIDVPLSGLIATYKPRSLYVAATGAIPLTERFSLIGKVGASFNRSRMSYFGDKSGSQSNNSVVASVGVSLKFTPAISGVAEYEHYGKLTDYNGYGLKSNVVSAGIQFAF